MLADRLGKAWRARRGAMMCVPLAAVLWMTSLLGGECEASKMYEFPGPPWTAAADETTVADSAAFTDCDMVLEMLALHPNGKITSREYSLSKQWGKVLRAKVDTEREGFTLTARVTCWSKPGSGAQIAVSVDDGGE